MAKFTRDAGFTRARKFGRDDDPTDLDAEIQALKGDPDADVRDYLGVIVDQCDPDQLVELSAALREIVERMDRGDGLARFGEDRRFARDQRRRARDARTRMGRDVEGMPSNGIEKMEGEDRRGRMAGDRLALDSSPGGAFRRLFPNAVIPERA